MTTFEVLNERHFYVNVTDLFHFESLAFSTPIVLRAAFVPTLSVLSIVGNVFVVEATGSRQQFEKTRSNGSKRSSALLRSNR
jgi:hypothetical protein